MIPTSELQRAVNDLLWAINSPSLLTEPVAIPPLDPIDFNQEQLAITIAANANRRVGKYFEQLIRYWLASIRGVTALEHSRQIRDGKRTIGELDFVFNDEGDRRTHLETAVKFYLYDPDTFINGSHFIGPNAADTFERKMKRLFEHQLPLGRQSVNGIARTMAIVKGRIFYHPGKDLPKELPAKLSRDHVRGSWIRQCETENFFDRQNSSRYRVMRKPHWLAGEVATLDDSSLLDAVGLAEHLERHFQKCGHPVLLSQLAATQRQYQETDRIFVVASDWPQPV